MLKNYFLIAFRNLLKHKLYSMINIAGLAIGLACCLLIVLYIADELSYDAWHAKAERTYRVIEDINLNGVTENSASLPFPVAPNLKAEFPEIEAYTRFFRPQSAFSMRYEDKLFSESGLLHADSTVFDVFSFALIAGDKRDALNRPNTIVLSRSMAQRYFGKGDPMGKTLLVEVGGAQDVGVLVSGVMEDVPHNSHIQFDALVSFATLNNIVGSQTMEQQWWWNPCWTYIVLPDSFGPDRLESLLPGFVEKYFSESIRSGISLSLQPLLDIHLHSQRDLEMAPNSNINYIYIFAAVALFVLFIACINFMNLATARSAGRAREVGMRKVMGAQRGQLIRQFLGESILISLVAIVLGAVLCELALPLFNGFSAKQLSVAWFQNWHIPLYLLAVGLLVGVFAGSYPAFFLSSFHPAAVLKGKSGRDARKGGLRKTLVVIQFSTSIALLIGSAVVLDQMKFVQEKNLGFNKDHTVLLKSVPPLFGRIKAFKSALLSQPGIESVTGMSETVGTGVQIRQFFPEGFSQDEPTALAGLGVDMDFLEVMDVDVVEGRGFSYKFPADTLRAFILNETAAQQLGWDDPIGKRFNMYLGPGPHRTGTIVGIVKDFNYASLHQPVESLVLFVWPFISDIAVKVRADATREAIRNIESVWKQFCPEQAFHYSFLDANIDKLYRAEMKLGDIVFSFALFAIIIACLGLFGLASFTVEQRVREIGIRKTLGASTLQIAVLLAGEFARLVLVAAVIAAPIAWFVMNSWLEDFAYRVNIGWQPFVLSALSALLIAMLTVGYKTIRAAMSNPVQTIGYR